MTIPVLLIAGFLGAGKTTLVNRLLREPGGRRIAAIVNDFGAIDIDAALLGFAGDGVVSLKNGCICCSLQGDLMRTLAALTRRRPRPDAIVVETSGASDPAEIVRVLLDPVIYAVTPLDTVVSMVDARSLSDRPDQIDDPLWRSQLGAADFLVIGKTDLVSAEELASVRDRLARRAPRKPIFEAAEGAVPADLLFFRGDHAACEHRARRTAVSTDRFETMSWTAGAPLSLELFQAAIGRLSPSLLRAKGFVSFGHRPDHPMLFQLVGMRATLVPAPDLTDREPPARLVLIAESGCLDRDRATALLDATAAPRASAPRVAELGRGRA